MLNMDAECNIFSVDDISCVHRVACILDQSIPAIVLIGMDLVRQFNFKIEYVHNISPPKSYLLLQGRNVLGISTGEACNISHFQSVVMCHVMPLLYAWLCRLFKVECRETFLVQSDWCVDFLVVSRLLVSINLLSVLPVPR